MLYEKYESEAAKIELGERLFEFYHMTKRELFEELRKLRQQKNRTEVQKMEVSHIRHTFLRLLEWNEKEKLEEERFFLKMKKELNKVRVYLRAADVSEYKIRGWNGRNEEFEEFEEGDTLEDVIEAAEYLLKKGYYVDIDKKNSKDIVPEICIIL